MTEPPFLPELPVYPCPRCGYPITSLHYRTGVPGVLAIPCGDQLTEAETLAIDPLDPSWRTP